MKKKQDKRFVHEGEPVEQAIVHDIKLLNSRQPKVQGEGYPPGGPSM